MNDPQRTIRNLVVCQRCDTRLIVESPPKASGEPVVSVIAFGCPACRGWNADVKVAGEGMLSVFLDPRTSVRRQA